MIHNNEWSNLLSAGAMSAFDRNVLSYTEYQKLFKSILKPIDEWKMDIDTQKRTYNKVSGLNLFRYLGD